MPISGQTQSLLEGCHAYLDDRVIPLYLMSDCTEPLLKALRSTPLPRPSKLVRLLHMEPCLAAHLIQLANSPLYRGPRLIDSIAAALSHLGAQTILSLVSALIQQAYYEIKNATIRTKQREWWQQSCQVAIISGLIAQNTPGYDPDRAELAGLMHNIGLIPVLWVADRYSQIPPTSDELDRVIKQLTNPLSLKIANGWRLSPMIVEAIESSESWQRDESTCADYCDIVMMARLHSMVGKSNHKNIPKLDELPAYRKIANGKLDIRFSIQLLDRAREEFNYRKELLKLGLDY